MLKFFDEDPDPGSGAFFSMDPGSGMETFGFGILRCSAYVHVCKNLYNRDGKMKMSRIFGNSRQCILVLDMGR